MDERTRGHRVAGRARVPSWAGPLRLSCRVVTAVGLGIDAYVHWRLAPRFDTLRGSGNPQVSMGELFRVEAVAALLVTCLVLVMDRPAVAAIAVLTAGAGVAAVLVYRYVDVGAFGPFPDMYDASWYTEKSVSAVGEAVAAVTASVWLLMPVPARPTGGQGTGGR